MPFTPKVFADSPFAGGDGDTGTPYQITDCIQLQATQDYLSSSFILNNDISCSDTKTWNDGKGFVPVGNNSAPFTGNFYGNNKTISGLYIDRAGDDPGAGEDDEQEVGLFGRKNGGIIENLTITNSRIRGYEDVGGVAGRINDGTIRNVKYNAGIESNESCDTNEYCIWTSGYNGGGIVGQAYDSNLENVVVGGTVNGSGSSIGGIVGYATATTISDATAHARINGGVGVGGIVGEIYSSEITRAQTDVSINGSGVLGGIAGYSEYLTITESESRGNITDEEFTNEDGRWIGGAIGFASNLSITDVHASSDITLGRTAAPELYAIGGLIGEYWYGHIQDSSASGNVYAPTAEEVGGLIGYTNELWEDGGAQNVYATGDVTGNYKVGGLIGVSEYTDIYRAYASGNVTGLAKDNGIGGKYEPENIGGLIGQTYGTYLYQSFASGNVTGSIDVGGLIGDLDYDAIYDSYATGNVTADGDYVGGLIGYVSNGDVYRTYSLGKVTNTNEDREFTGGLIGSGWANDSFWDTQTSGWTTSEAGTGKTSAQMKDVATYTDLTTAGLDEAWDFVGDPNDDEGEDDIWTIAADVNSGYPCLAWQGEDCEFLGAEAPTGNDYNLDGTDDAGQTNVGRYTSPVSGKIIALEASVGCVVSVLNGQAENELPTKDAAFDYASGLTNFTLDCSDADSPTITVTLFYWDVASNGKGFVVRKYNPNTSAFFTINSAAISQVLHGNTPVTKTTYQITDGGELDIDGQANGTIVDPVGLASQTVGSPNTGLQRLR